MNNLFNLPKLHPSIPKKAIAKNTDQSVANLTRLMIGLGILKLSDVSDRAKTSSDILSQGISKWFSRRLKGLRFLSFGMIVMDIGRIRSIFDQFELPDNDRQFFTVICESEPFFKISRRFRQLERTVPGLTKTVFSAIQSAGYRTVPVRTVDDLYEYFCMQYWDGEMDLTDEEATPCLEDRMGEDEDFSEYLPSFVKKVFACDILNFEIKPFSDQRITEVSNETNSPYLKSLCEEIIKLRQMTSDCEKFGIHMPHLDLIESEDCYVDPMFQGCCLIFDKHDHIQQSYEAEINGMMESGGGTDVIGFSEIPDDPKLLLKFFNDMEKLLALLLQMDKVIGLISNKKPVEFQRL